VANRSSSIILLVQGGPELLLDFIWAQLDTGELNRFNSN